MATFPSPPLDPVTGLAILDPNQIDAYRKRQQQRLANMVTNPILRGSPPNIQDILKNIPAGPVTTPAPTLLGQSQATPPGGDFGDFIQAARSPLDLGSSSSLGRLSPTALQTALAILAGRRGLFR
jgi:hypothetical protein